jgi:hypothetical protein
MQHGTAIAPSVAMTSPTDMPKMQENASLKPTAPLSDERRRLLRGTLAAGPVLMTVISRPVLGQTTCLAASVATSINPSGAARTASVCSGLTPSQWKARAAQWPSPYHAMTLKSLGVLGASQATAYHCPTTGLNGRVYGDRTMLEVIDINEGGVGTDALGRYIVASLLNARSGRTPVLTEVGVRAMWNDLINSGYYEPTAGIRWTAAEIIRYLKTTMG